MSGFLVILLLVTFGGGDAMKSLYDRARPPVKVYLTHEQQLLILKMKQIECFNLMQKPPPDDGLYCNATWDGIMCWDYTPAGEIARQKCSNYINGFNSQGLATRDCLSNGTWAPHLDPNKTSGWSNYTGCRAEPAPPEISIEDIQNHLFRIKLMSDIGYALSLASLVVAVLIMIGCKRLHCKSNVLHINLFIAFILRSVITLTKGQLFVEGVGLEKDIERLPDGRVMLNEEGTLWECKLIVTLLYYSVSASLMWISMEALYLQMLVYRTLFTERHGTRIYVLLGWTLPLLYIIPWIFVRIYLEDQHCWTLYENDMFMWIIRGPITVSVVINFIFFINISRVLCLRAGIKRNVRNEGQHARKTAKFVLVLIPLFGVIYIIFSCFPNQMSLQMQMINLYAEMFYNSFQGFLLALLFCFLNEEVHNELRRCLFRHRPQGFHTRSILLSSWRRNSRSSRADTLTRGPHLLENGNHVKHASKPCKVNRKCQEHVTWKSSKRDASNNSSNTSNSWKADCAGSYVVVSDMSDGSTAHV